jgi:hypothetical protein
MGDSFDTGRGGAYRGKGPRPQRSGGHLDARARLHMRTPRQPPITREVACAWMMHGGGLVAAIGLGRRRARASAKFCTSARASPHPCRSGARRSPAHTHTAGHITRTGQVSAVRLHHGYRAWRRWTEARRSSAQRGRTVRAVCEGVATDLERRHKRPGGT